MNDIKKWLLINRMRFFTDIGLEDTVFDMDEDDDGEYINVDFMPNGYRENKPSFAGAYFKNNKALRITNPNEGKIVFSACSPDGRIKSMYVEIKALDRNKYPNHESFKIKLTPEKQQYVIKFSDFQNEENYKYMGEITFVLKPGNFADKNIKTGKLIIDDIDIIDSEMELAPDQDDIMKRLLVLYEEIYNYMKTDLSDMLQKQKAELKQTPEDSLSEDDRISKMFEYCTHNINETIRNNSIKDQEEELKVLFGDIWDNLLDHTRLSLISAKSMWDACKKLDSDFDYSGICICATCALENELRDIFCTSFNRYLKKTRYYIKGVNEFVLGSVLYLITKDNSKNDKTSIYFNDGTPTDDRIAKKLWDHYFEDIRTDCIVRDSSGRELRGKEIWGNSNFGLVKQIEDIREQYRNKAAHSESVDKNTAEKCYNEIVGKSQAAAILTRTPTVLQELYRIIDIKKLKDDSLKNLAQGLKSELSK